MIINGIFSGQKPGREKSVASAQTTLNAYLEDRYLNTRTNLRLTTSTLVPFSVNTTPASAAEDRFRVVFTPNDVLPVTITSIKAYQMQAGINVSWTTEHEANIKMFKVERSLDGQQFTKMASVPIDASSSSVHNYSWFDGNPKDGSNYYRIQSIEQSGISKYSKIVSASISVGKGSFDVYPNPITGDYSTVVFNNVSKGKYTLKLISSSGQLILKTTINHPGGSTSQNIAIDPHLSKGTYTLQITGNGISFDKQILK